MPSWNADLYLRFERERTRPCEDLVSRIPLEQVGRAVDLGCGPGNSTAVIGARYPEAELLGVDSSEAMLTQARAAYPQWHWETGDVRTWKPERPVDLLLSNAMLQWVPEHETVIPGLLEQVAEGGALAVQIPRNDDAPAHVAMRTVAARPQWAGKVPPGRTLLAHPPAHYYDLLAPRCTAVDLWETEYFHVLPDAEAIVEWLKGTGLRPYLDPLSPDDQVAFLAEYRELVEADYPAQADGRVLFAFRRTFFIAVK